MVKAEASGAADGAGSVGVGSVDDASDGVGTGIGEFTSTGGAGGGGKMSLVVVWP